MKKRFNQVKGVQQLKKKSYNKILKFKKFLLINFNNNKIYKNLCCQLSNKKNQKQNI